MPNGFNFSAIDASASAMAAERFRMEVVASNIANAQSTDSGNGQPYQRKQVVFATSLEQAAGSDQRGAAVGGVRVASVESDQAPFPMVYIPGHPHANEAGMVAMPNVKLPNEMVDLITASRSYEANLRAIRTFQQMAEQTISLLRGNG